LAITENREIVTGCVTRRQVYDGKAIFDRPVSFITFLEKS
jgi:hypothetical protein